MKVHELRPRSAIRSPTSRRDPSGQWPGASSDRVPELHRHRGRRGESVRHRPDCGAPRELHARSGARRRWIPWTACTASYDGIVNGMRFVNDDNDNDPLTGDPRIDEDFLDGRDNDGDGLIDEDFARASASRCTPASCATTRRRRSTPRPRNATCRSASRCQQERLGLLDPGLSPTSTSSSTTSTTAPATARLARDRLPHRHGLRPGRQVELLERRLQPAALPVRRLHDPDRRTTTCACSRQADHVAVPDVNAGLGALPAVCKIQRPGLLGGGRRRRRIQDAGHPHVHADRPHDRSDWARTARRKVGLRAFRSFPSGTPYVQGGNADDRPAALRVHDRHRQHRQRSEHAGAHRLHQRRPG